MPKSKARVIWLQYQYFLLILMTNLDSFFFIWSNLLLSTFYKAIPKLGNYRMVTKGRIFFNQKKKKKALISLSCMGCFIQTHHNSQLTLLNDQEKTLFIQGYRITKKTRHHWWLLYLANKAKALIISSSRLQAITFILQYIRATKCFRL